MGDSIEPVGVKSALQDGQMVRMSMESIAVLRLPGQGVWMSGYSDGTGVTVHQSELEAYRDSAGFTRDVAFVHWNESFLDALNRKLRESREDQADD